jgi:hypothetical protein
MAVNFGQSGLAVNGARNRQAAPVLPRARAASGSRELTVFLQCVLAQHTHHRGGEDCARWGNFVSVFDWMGLLLILFLIMPIVTARPGRY